MDILLSFVDRGAWRYSLIASSLWDNFHVDRPFMGGSYV